MSSTPRTDGWLSTLTERLKSHYAVDSGSPHDRLAERLRELAALGNGESGPRFEILGRIASGGMGSIALAYDHALLREVAIKHVHREDSRSDGLRRVRLLAEAETLGRLQHPGIVPVYDLSLDGEGEPFFAMQRVDGEDFARILAGRRKTDDWPVARCVEILRRVCDTVAHAHARGVVHRDLKPANVMLGTHGAVYVMDWGLARRLTDTADVPNQTDPAEDCGNDEGDPALTRLGSVLGTPSYMAPEQADGTIEVERPADVFAVGAMLYEVLAGVPAYTSEQPEWSVDEILDAIRSRPPTPVAELAPGADEELVAICECAMARDPAARYATIDDLAMDLRAWSEGRVVRAHPPNSVVRVFKWIRRRRELATVIAASAAVLLVAFVWFVVSMANARDRAARSAEIAQDRLAELRDLAVVEQIADLRQRADRDLWPVRPEVVPAIAAWLTEAESIRGRRDDLAEFETRIRADSSSTFARWRGKRIADAIDTLDEFFAPDASGIAVPLGSTVDEVRKRIAAAHQVATSTVDGDAAREAWTHARAAISGSEVYGGLDLPPQLGLRPLGPDSTSGLYEFAHTPSGAAPARNAAGALVATSSTCIVFVLLPAGTFRMGSQRPSAGVSEDTANLDPFAEELNETPVREVTLDPFFVSKWEVTQAQWRRLTGTEPSVHGAHSTFVAESSADVHPVESVDWFEGARVVRRLGLALPTEAQWEYAARAGTTTPWSIGATIRELVDPPGGNFADTTSARTHGTQSWDATQGLDDGFVMHAPVGSFPSNAYGLHDVHGNVKEWCAEDYVSYARDPAPGDGARARSDAPATAMYRGGGFDEAATEARSANRAGAPPTRRHFSIGVRPVRAVR